MYRRVSLEMLTCQIFFTLRWKDLLECISSTLAQFFRKFDREVQDHVPPLLRALGQREAFSNNPLFHSRFDNVSGGHSDGPAVQCWGVDCASTQRLQRMENKVIRHMKPLMFS